MRDVALVPERDVLEPDDRRAAHDAREPADALGDDGVPLVRHRRRALLPAAERLLHLGDLGAREMPDLERELVERRRDDRERGQQLGVAVALEDLRRRRRRLEAEPLAGDALELGIGRGVRADGAGELADAHALERARDALPVPVELERPARELQPERRRLGVHAVRAAHLQRRAMLLGARDDDGERRVEALEDERAGGADLERERGVDDVGGGEAVVEPAALLAELLGDGVDEGGRVVVERRLELGDPLRARRDGLLLERPRGLLGDDPELGPGGGRRELDVEPGPQLALVRPDAGHGGTRIAGDHWLQSRADPGRRIRPRASPVRGTVSVRRAAIPSGPKCGSKLVNVLAANGAPGSSRPSASGSCRSASG